MFIYFQYSPLSLCYRLTQYFANMTTVLMMTKLLPMLSCANNAMPPTMLYHAPHVSQIFINDQTLLTYHSDSGYMLTCGIKNSFHYYLNFLILRVRNKLS